MTKAAPKTWSDFTNWVIFHETLIVETNALIEDKEPLIDDKNPLIDT